MQVMERPGVRRETNGPVTTIILDRPERRNAVDPPTAEALRAAVRAFDQDRTARVAVLWGAGGTFCAGYDLKAFAAAPRRLARAYGEGPMGPTRIRLGKPVIAAVSGHAVAGGFELALWGVPLVDGGTVRLPAVVGFGRALDLILTGRPVDAREAERIGLANRVVAKGHARAAAEALAAEIAAFPPRCVLSDRRSAYESAGGPLEVALRREFELGRVTIDSGESREGAARFAAGAGRHGAF